MKKTNIVLGVTGGIAAYKACDFISWMKSTGLKNGYEVNVDVIMTPAALEFITPLTLQTLSKNKVNIDMFEQVDIMKPEHISLAERSNLTLVMPATANTIGKIVCGIADNLLTTVLMATTAPIVVCPAMNNNMWSNRYNQKNVAILRENPQYTIIDPIEGNLACGIRAIGALAKVNTIVDKVDKMIMDRELFLL